MKGALGPTGSWELHGAEQGLPGLQIHSPVTDQPGGLPLSAQPQCRCPLAGGCSSPARSSFLSAASACSTAGQSIKHGDSICLLQPIKAWMAPATGQRHWLLFQPCSAGIWGPGSPAQNASVPAKGKGATNEAPESLALRSERREEACASHGAGGGEGEQQGRSLGCTPFRPPLCFCSATVGWWQVTPMDIGLGVEKEAGTQQKYSLELPCTLS